MKMDENDRFLKRYIKKKYYKDDKKVITIHVEDEKELYNPLDGLKDTLRDDVTDYLERSAETLLPLNKINIKIESKTKVDLENFQRCLKVHYGIENLNCERIEKMVNNKKIFLLVVAVITMISFAFKDSLYEIKSFALTLSIWEYIDMKLYKDEEEEIKKYIFELLENASVIE